MTTLPNLLFAMSAGLFVIGLFTLLTGVIILFIRSMGKESRTITKQVTRLAQKGIAEDISGLVGNASNLLSATSELIKTTRGIGTFLTIVGAILMLLGICLALYLNYFQLNL